MERFSYREIQEWGAYFSIEPFGQDRDNLHAAIVASVIANVFGGKGKKAQPSDFMFRDHQEAETEKIAAMFKHFDAMKDAGRLDG